MVVNNADLEYEGRLPWEPIGFETIEISGKTISEMVSTVALELDRRQPRINTLMMSNDILSKSRRSEEPKAVRAVLESIHDGNIVYRIEAVY